MIITLAACLEASAGFNSTVLCKFSSGRARSRVGANTRAKFDFDIIFTDPYDSATSCNNMDKCFSMIELQSGSSIIRSANFLILYSESRAILQIISIYRL